MLCKLLIERRGRGKNSFMDTSRSEGGGSKQNHVRREYGRPTSDKNIRHQRESDSATLDLLLSLPPPNRTTDRKYTKVSAWLLCNNVLLR